MGKVSPCDIRRGIDPKASIGFTPQEIGEGVDKVTFSEALAAGEYAFVLTGANTAARVYDFSIG